MNELIELREYCLDRKEKANDQKRLIEKVEPDSMWVYECGNLELAFSDIIERLDLILNNSVVNPSVTSSFSLMILEAEYHKLKLQIFKAEKEMALSPNEYSCNFLNGYRPHLQNLEKAISVLQNCG